MGRTARIAFLVIVKLAVLGAILGSYALDVMQPEGEALVGEVITLNGPLEAKGQVRLDGRRYALDVFAGGDDTLNAELTNALALLAEPEPDGYRIALEGEF